MMKMIQRRSLGNKLDYISESEWASGSPPAKPAPLVRRMGNPKPDMMIAFQRDKVINDDQEQSSAIERLDRRISPEGSAAGSQRAFPFCFIEAKRVSSTNADTAALHQCLNAASHALVNIWMVMREVRNGKEMMKSVRVFTVAAHSKSVVVRMHRVQQLRKKSAYPEPDFPWSFEFVELDELNEQYEKVTVCRLVLSIFFKYGVERLLPKLQSAIEAIVNNADEKAEADEFEQPDNTQSPDDAESPGGTQQSDEGQDNTISENDGSQRPSRGVASRRQQSNPRGPRRSKQAKNTTNTRNPSVGSRKRAAEQDPNASFQSKASKVSQLSELRGMVEVLET